MPAEGIALLERVDGHAGLRNALRQMAREKGEWAGIPMPLEGAPLIIEPRYPHAAALMKISRDVGDALTETDEYSGWNAVNSWYARQKGGEVILYRKSDGRADWGLAPNPHHATMELSTLGAADAWGIEQEARAIQLLGKQLRHRQFKQYLLTGMFIEKSRRSGLHYLFRKLRPTVVMTERTRGFRLERPEQDEMRILCCLCLHPIGHYANSWAGAMCPTDDVLAHLMLMRGERADVLAARQSDTAAAPERGTLRERLKCQSK